MEPPLDYAYRYVTATYLPPIISGTGNINSTATGAIMMSEEVSSPGYLDDIKIFYVGSLVKDSSGSIVPGSRGVVNFQGTTEDYLGRIDENQSKGAQTPVKIDTAKLLIGLNSVCIYATSQARWQGTFNRSTPTGFDDLADDELDGAYAKWCTNVYYPPQPPPPTVVPECTGSTPTARISWPDSSPSASNYSIDIDNDGDWLNGFWRRDEAPPTLSIADAPSGFNGVFGASGELAFSSGGAYSARVWYFINGNWVQSEIQDFTARSGCAPAGPPPTVTCGASLLTTPGGPEPGQMFNANFSFTVVPVPAANLDYSVNFVYPAGISYGGPNPQTGTLAPPGSNATMSFNGLSAPAAGRYNVTMQITGGVTKTCDYELVIARKPYFRVYGGDVLAGARSFYACTPPVDASANPVGAIVGWNRGGSPDYGGAGAQLAAFAIEAIDQFTTATLRAGPPGPPAGLSFANTTSPPYGGSFGETACMHSGADGYYDNLLPVTPPPSPAPYVISGSDTFKREGDLTISGVAAGGMINAGQKVVIYVKGNVTITTSIRYNPAGWTTPDMIPSFRLVVVGNIYIAPGVTQLDGVYIAQPGEDPPGGGGEFYSCVVAPPALPSPAAGCDAKLTVNGAVIAHTMRLWRTGGTLSGSSTAESGTTSTNIAEVFNFSPELYLDAEAELDPNGYDYDAITSLPPVL